MRCHMQSISRQSTFAARAKVNPKFEYLPLSWFPEHKEINFSNDFRHLRQCVELIVFSFLYSEHFPYFKTAPAGWKNSVRHNLSLNKCFEKIEKPQQNGSNARKGCLWAMNPAKITKMDEEVQKWSRKDPMAIKKGMILPRKFFFSFSETTLQFF